MLSAFAGRAQTTKPAVRSKIAAKPNAILITIDTLRADHVGCYGAKTVKTPTLDALASDGVVFERAISQVPLTWPSHAVILTGTYPFQNGVQDFTGQPLAPKFRSVAQAFKSAGYATGAVVSAFVLDRSWGLARGFDFYDDAFSAETFKQKDIGLVDRRAEESVAHALAWLKKTPRRPFFLWLHLYDPHSPYDPPEPYRTEYRGKLYDGEIAYADHELGKLIAWLKLNKLYESTLIVATSDHGESLGEHGEDEHGFFIYNSTVHVPLIVKPPAGQLVSLQRRGEPVETAAIAPSLLELARIKDQIQAQFQVPALFDQKTPGRDSAYSETYYPFSSFGWSPLRGLESERYHYINAPTPELYDLENDQGESQNIANQQPAIVAVLKQKLQERTAKNPIASQTADKQQASTKAAATLSPDAQQKLQSLGYFGFHAAVSPEKIKAGLPDPKEKITEFNSILKAQDAFQRGDAERGERLLLEVQQRDPQMYVIPFMLGEAALRRQDWEKAAAQLQRCLDLNPEFDNAMTGLALALTRLGHADEAKVWLNKAVKSNPQNYRAWYQLGLVSAAFVDLPGAQSAYERALSIQPNFPPAQRDLGMLLFQQKNYSAAAPHLERAIVLGLADSHLHNFLGICYSRTNQLQKAVQNYREALKLEPELSDAHLNLAFALQRLGNNKEARSEYDTACRLEPKYCSLPSSRQD